ncbi:MAG: outer membrane protein assembly factor BamD [Candidatus Acidiferrum sp.]
MISKQNLPVKSVALSVLTAFFLMAATTCDAQLPFHKKKKIDKSTSADNNAQPDKILYDRAVDDIKHGRQEIGRLNMQTLINTYPDSEYLAKAKLAIADSYYKEGGTSNLALAISGYKDFEVFFPFLPEATYAQMQVAMAHYRQMEKPDRDRTQAYAAEDEFQIFLQKYPNDPLAPQALQRLRDVQEVLAEGDYRIGYFYYLKGDKRAAATRLLTVTQRYPLYSKSDKALWMMGDIFETSEHKDVAARYYARIVKEYPLSNMVPDAKAKLKEIGAPIPQPDPSALAWMTADEKAPREHTSLLKRPMELMKSGPTDELLTAARTGEPNLSPESDTLSAGDLLKPEGAPRLGGPGATTGIVATISPGGGTAGETTSGAESVAPVTNEGGATVGTVGGPPVNEGGATVGAVGGPPANEGGATVGAVGAAPASDPPKDAGAPATPATAASANAEPATADPSSTAKMDPAPAAAEAKSDGTTAGAKKTSDAAKGDSSNDKDKKESSSKKKKGLHKLIPW